MVRFDNKSVEAVCEALLTPEDNRLKVVTFEARTNQLIGTEPEYLDMLRRERAKMEEDLKKMDHLILISELVVSSGAKPYEED